MNGPNRLSELSTAEVVADESIERARVKPLCRLYSELSSFEVAYHPKGIQMLDDIMDKLDEYTAVPDMWHNTSMAASRVRHHEAELAIVQSGLREWPDDVDLLCDELQLRYTTSYDLEEAQRIWKHLCGLDRSKTGPYWRYWAYGAIFHAITLGDVETGMQLLNEGLRFVKRDGLMNIFRSYRRILVDSTPIRSIPEEGEDGGDPVQAYQREALDELERLYKTGIELGVENGYVLAIELARLYQERAAMSPTDEQVDYLEEALKYLDMAEALYTGSPNHPISQIYEAKIRVLMAQGEYSQALILLRSLPQLGDISLQTMYRCALQRTGEKLEEEKHSQETPSLYGQMKGDRQRRLEEEYRKATGSNEQSVLEIADILGDESVLYQLAHSNPSILETIFKVAYRIQQEMEDSHD